MKLRYKASTKEGKISQGLLEAKDITEAANYLRNKQLTPIEIKSASGKFFGGLGFGKGAKHSDLVLFTRQLSSMLASGLTLMRALEILKDQMQNQNMSDVTSEIITDVSEGRTLAQAIDKHPKIFSPIYRSIIAAGEQSGLMDKVLLRLADNLEKQEKLQSTVKSALLYPAIVILLMVGVMSIMIGFVIPQLTGLYTSLHIELPITTKIVVGVSSFFITAWPIMIGLVLLMIFLFRRWHKTPDGQLVFDTVLLKLPVFGKLIKQSILAEFARTLGLLVGTGTLVVEALNETADTAGNVLYRNAILEVCKKVEKGVSLGDPMAYYSLFPPLLIQLVRVGEQTGKMDDSLLRASEYFEREVDQTVKTLTTAIEPFIMVFLGIGVAFLIISVLTPIYSLITSIQ